MSRLIYIRTYSPRTVQILRQTLADTLHGVWLEEHLEKIFHICDELIKNGIKSNYRTILYWMEARKLLLAANPEIDGAEADRWLHEVFFSGENDLIDRQFQRLDKGVVLKNLLEILEMEAAYIDHRSGRKRVANPHSLKNLLRIKRFCRRHSIGVQLRIETVSTHFNITVENDAPILDDDLARIQAIRSTFRQYQRDGNEEQYFLEHIDTSGGGHGLGYPLMDALLSSMNLDPDTSLYLISATRTMILLTLPFLEPDPLLLLPAP